MLDVSVPCGACGGAIGFGQGRCPKCGARVSSEAREALHERLEASSQDYRDLQGHISSGRTALLVASLGYLVLASLAMPVLLADSSGLPEEGAIVVIAFGLDLLLGAAFLLLWWLARRWPATGLLLAAGLWLAMQLGLVTVAILIGSYSLIFSGIWLKVVVGVLMLRGIIAGLRARSLVAKLVQPSG